MIRLAAVVLLLLVGGCFATIGALTGGSLAEAPAPKRTVVRTEHHARCMKERTTIYGSASRADPTSRAAILATLPDCTNRPTMLKTVETRPDSDHVIDSAARGGFIGFVVDLAVIATVFIIVDSQGGLGPGS